MLQWLFFKGKLQICHNLSALIEKKNDYGSRLRIKRTFNDKQLRKLNKMSF